jgi:hypothetical protein
MTAPAPEMVIEDYPPPLADTAPLPEVEPEAPKARTARKPRSTGRSARAPRARTRTPSPSRTAKPDHTASVLNLLEMIGTVVAFTSPLDAVIIEHQAPAVARAWGDLAARNASVARVLDRLGQPSVWSEAVMSTAMLVGALGSAHKLLPPPVDHFFRGTVEQLSQQLAQQVADRDRESSGAGD